jgi:hypothetical protein
MGSIAEATSSLGQTVTQMLPMMFDLLIRTPLNLSFGFIPQ